MSVVIKLATGLTAGALLAAALAPVPADARLFGKKKAPVDFSAALPASLPPPPPANGAIFQVNAGYAALYEGSRARRVGARASLHRARHSRH